MPTPTIESRIEQLENNVILIRDHITKIYKGMTEILDIIEKKAKEEI